MRTNVPSMVAGFLCHTGERDPEVLFQSFAHYLLTSSDAWTLPVPLEKIRRHHGFQCHGRALLNRGMLLGQNIFVNSDDPAYFGGYLNENFVQTFEALPALTARDAWQLAANSFEASFAPPEDKARWRAALDACFAQAAADA